jgi:hypothetical protein
MKGAGPGLALVPTGGPVNLSSNSQINQDSQTGDHHYHQMAERDEDIYDAVRGRTV